MTENVIDVAAGVLINASGEILLAKRPEGKHMAGYWEFPGGKFEAGEDAAQALARELEEELGVSIAASEPLIEISHSYPERTVRLHVRTVRDWKGQISGLDNQALAWVKKGEMDQWDLLPADGPIVNAIKLPRRYAISPVLEDVVSAVSWLEQLPNDVNLIQWRQPRAEGSSLAQDKMLAEVASWASLNGIDVLVNASLSSENIAWGSRHGLAGLHLSEANLRSACLEAANEAKSKELLLAASVHDQIGIELAQKLGVDFSVLGPVCKTASHPGARPLGWERFGALVAEANLPVYALGGCGEAQLENALKHGAQGFAGISAFRS